MNLAANPELIEATIPMPSTPKPSEATAGLSGRDGNNPPAKATAGRPECDVQVDESRNLVRIRYSGHVTVAEMKAVTVGAEGILSKVRPGFTVLADLSSLESMDLDCAPELTGMMDKFRARGIGMAVRIIPDPRKDIGFNILAIVHYRRGVRVVTCKTAAEAERVLKP